MLPLYVLVTLAGVGYYITKEQSKVRSNTYAVKSTDDDIYNSHYIDRVNDMVSNQNAHMYEQGQRPQETGVISNNYALNNQRSVQSRLSGVEIPMDEFTHNNMVPYFKGSVKQNINEHANRTLMETYTGVYDKPPKKEVEFFGDIQENMGNVYGSTGAYTTELERIQAGRNRNNTLPFEQTRVGPGLNRGFSAQPTGGYQQFDARDYAQDRNVDELRVKTKPKLTYNGRVVDGMKEELPADIGTVSKNRVETFYDNDPDMWFTTTGAVIKDAQRPEEIVKYTQRIETNREYGGNAYANRGSETRPDVKESTRQNLKDFGVRNVAVDHNGTGSKDDYGRKNILVYTNERDVTACRTYEGNVTSLIKALIAPLEDLARSTKSEYNIQHPRTFGNMSMQVPNKQTIYDPNDVARTTIKETTIHDTHVGNLKGNKVASVVYDPDDVTRVTTRQTLPNAMKGDTNLRGAGAGRTTMRDPDNKARTTTKETTIESERDGNIDGLPKDGAYKTTGVDPKITQRQFTSNHSYKGNVYVRDADGYKIANYDPRFTQRVSTTDNDYYGVAGSANDKTMSYEDVYNAQVNDTRETTLHGRAPTKTSVKVAVGGDMVRMESTKDVCNTVASRTFNNQNHVVNEIPSKNLVQMTHDRQQLQEDDRLDVSILTAFRQNPYTKPLDSVA